MSSYGPPPGDPHAGLHGASSEERTWALAAHIGSLVSAWFAFGFLAPLLVMLVKTDSPFVRRHAAESLNFQISILIYSVVGAVLAFLVVVLSLGIGLIVVVPIAVVVLLVVLVLVLKATARASAGQDYRYPFTIRFID